MSIDVPDTLELSALRATGQQPGEELLPEVAPPPLMTPDVEVKGILGSHGNEEDDSLYSPLLCQSLCHFCSFPPFSVICRLFFSSFSFSAFSVFRSPSVAVLFVYFYFVIMLLAWVFLAYELSEHHFCTILHFDNRK